MGFAFFIGFYHIVMNSVSPCLLGKMSSLESFW